MRRREQKLWLGTFTDTTQNSTQMGMTSMWRWSPLLQHLHLGLISPRSCCSAKSDPCFWPWALCLGIGLQGLLSHLPASTLSCTARGCQGWWEQGRDGWGMSAKDKPAAAWRRLLLCANHSKPLNCSIISFVHSIIQNVGVCWSWLKFTLKQEILFQAAAQIYLASR